MLPALTPEAKRLAYEMGSDWALPGENINFQSADDFDSWDRCITRGMPSMMMPYRYNGGFRIQQAPGYVVFEIEMIHEARVISDGRPQAARSRTIKQYLGCVARPLGRGRRSSSRRRTTGTAWRSTIR